MSLCTGWSAFSTLWAIGPILQFPSTQALATTCATRRASRACTYSMSALCQKHERQRGRRPGDLARRPGATLQSTRQELALKLGPLRGMSRRVSSARAPAGDNWYPPLGRGFSIRVEIYLLIRE